MWLIWMGFWAYLWLPPCRDAVSVAVAVAVADGDGDSDTLADTFVNTGVCVCMFLIHLLFALRRDLFTTWTLYEYFLLTGNLNRIYGLLLIASWPDRSQGEFTDNSIYTTWVFRLEVRVYSYNSWLYTIINNTCITMNQPKHYVLDRRRRDIPHKVYIS